LDFITRIAGGRPMWVTEKVTEMLRT
jgi:hypothetical protein